MRLLVLLWGCLGLPGSKALSGPKEISAFEGDTVSLQCTYEEKLKEHRKYWCRESGFLLSRCAGIVYSKEDREVTRDRVSIRDSPQELSLTVTMRGLTLKDAGKYWCGVDRLGFGEAFKVSLTVFPGKGDSPSTTGVSPLPSFQSLIATSSLKHSTKAWQTQPPELTSPDLHLTVAMAKQGKTGAEAPVFTGAAPAWSTGTSPPPGISPHTGSTPHTATSPHAGSSRPAIWLPPTTPKGSSAVTSNSVSKPSASIPTVRMLAPVLVLLSLLLATGLIAFGSYMLQWRKKAWLAAETQMKEKVYLPTSLGKGWDSEDAVINLAASSRPFGSPKLSAGPSVEIQYLSQSTEDEVAPSQDSEDDIMTTPPLMSSEELGFSEFISV